MTNKIAPSTESATRFTLTWSIGRGTFGGWSKVEWGVRFVDLISRFALALATRISPGVPNLA
jgi:hypothetical protein